MAANLTLRLFEASNLNTDAGDKFKRAKELAWT